jgi:hypothetical protein
MTKLTDWQNDKNHIIVRYNDTQVIYEPISYFSYRERYKIARALKLKFWDSIRLITNQYPKRPTYKHYEVLFESDDVLDCLPVLIILCKSATVDENTRKQMLLDMFADYV